MDGFITPLTLSNKLHAKLYYLIGSKTFDIHMSKNDSIDEEIKKLLEEIPNTDDSKESKEKEKDKKYEIKEYKDTMSFKEDGEDIIIDFEPEE